MGMVVSLKGAPSKKAPKASLQSNILGELLLELSGRTQALKKNMIALQEKLSAVCSVSPTIADPELRLWQLRQIQIVRDQLLSASLDLYVAKQSIQRSNELVEKLGPLMRAK